MFTFYGESDDHRLLTMHPADLKGRSHGADVAGTHRIYSAMISQWSDFCRTFYDYFLVLNPND